MTVRVLLDLESVTAGINPRGALLGGLTTVAVKCGGIQPTSPSSAVTLIVAEPSATGVSVRVEPDTLAVTDAVFEEPAEKVRLSPSESLKTLDKLMVVASLPKVRVTLESDPCGRLLATVAVNVAFVLSVPSLAVTVIVELPPLTTGVIVSVEPDTLAVTYVVSEELAEKVSASPSGSLKLFDKLMVCAPPLTLRVTLESDPVGLLLVVSGAGGAGSVSVTVTEKATLAHRPEGSDAVMVIFVFPFATGVMTILSGNRICTPKNVTLLKLTETVATDVTLELTA